MTGLSMSALESALLDMPSIYLGHSKLGASSASLSGCAPTQKHSHTIFFHLSSPFTPKFGHIPLDSQHLSITSHSSAPPPRLPPSPRRSMLSSGMAGGGGLPFATRAFASPSIPDTIQETDREDGGASTAGSSLRRSREGEGKPG